MRLPRDAGNPRTGNLMPAAAGDGGADVREPPSLHNVRSVAAIIAAHRDYGRLYTDASLGASWEHIGRLTHADRTGAQTRYVAEESRALDPLVAHTAYAVPFMDARTVAVVAHGLATAQRASGWRGADGLWSALAKRVVSAVYTREFEPHNLFAMGHAYAKAGRTSPALSHAINSTVHELHKPPAELERQLSMLRQQKTKEVYPEQRGAAARVAARAVQASAKATPLLLGDISAMYSCDLGY